MKARLRVRDLSVTVWQAAEGLPALARAVLAAAPLVMACFVAGTSHAADTPAYDHLDPATGFRVDRYQAAVPEAPPAGTRVWIDDIDLLVRDERAILIDVSPITGLGYDPATGRWRAAKAHQSLPGAVWLPEVGRGALEPTIERYLAYNLARLTDGDRARALILFCHADCWMSWNAMKRVNRLGYTRLYWFPEGTDGWRDWDRELVPIEPVPIDISQDGGGQAR